MQTQRAMADSSDVVKVTDDQGRPTIRIIMLGDSHTNRPIREFGLIDRIHSELQRRYPLLSFDIMNKGSNGNRIKQIRDRLAVDVFPFNPDVVVLYWDSDAEEDETVLSPEELIRRRELYEVNVRLVLTRLMAHGATVIMSGPTLLGERPHGLNEDDAKVDDYRRINRRIAKDMGIEYVDTRAAFFAAIPQGGIICGLPTKPIISKFHLQFYHHVGVGLLSSCWLQKMLSYGLSMVLTTRNKVFGMGMRELGTVTIDGQHLNKYGTIIVAKLFTDALDRWLRNRTPSATLVLDSWASEVGDDSFNADLYPDPTTMMQTVHELGFQVVLSVTPFCLYGSMSCAEWENAGVAVRLSSPDTILSQKGTYQTQPLVLDVSNPAAIRWFNSRLRAMKLKLGVDGFSFTLGDSSLSSYVDALMTTQTERLFFDLDALKSKGGYLPMFASLSAVDNLGAVFCYSAGAALRNGQASVLMSDLTPSWGYDNGLSASVSKVLSVWSIYRGVSYAGALTSDGTTLPSLDLFVRWMQANALLPLQFKIAPWNYSSDNNTTAMDAYGSILRLRRQMSSYLRQALKVSQISGVPLVRPIWAAHLSSVSDVSERSWMYGVEDQIMIGDDVMMAPLLTQDSTARRVLVLFRTWSHCGSNNSFVASVTNSSTRSYFDNISMFNFSYNILCYHQNNVNGINNSAISL